MSGGQKGDAKHDLGSAERIFSGATLGVASTFGGLRKRGLDPEKAIPLFDEDEIIHLLPSWDIEEQRRLWSGAQGAETIDDFAANFGTLR